MDREKTKAAFLLWVFILIVEIVWFYLKRQTLFTTGETMFFVTVIIVTLSVGALGIRMFGSTKED
ncbi:hypothetical protein [Ureibacillus chungkukjangi]|uniref:Uncharacterized protein n=1 Tax=Ureibacillus chungkukjangi TaxID=1202712 RepID=A0A318U2F0_9BACL|nr:hypothetical protein [Ureibacillus chungkukjangi]PYF06109.1 hypothetical protein BJ095_11270 [Ureibacillus chungkukjangi]